MAASYGSSAYFGILLSMPVSPVSGWLRCSEVIRAGVDFGVDMPWAQGIRMQECQDTIKEEDGSGRQLLHRYVRIPFTLSYFSGNIKMTMEVENNKPKNEASICKTSTFETHFGPLTQSCAESHMPTDVSVIL